MAEAVRGGAYQSADGRWHDANGKPLPSSKVQEAQELSRKQAEETAQAESNRQRALAAQAGVMLPGTLLSESEPAREIVRPRVVDEEKAEEELTAKRGRSRKS